MKIFKHSIFATALLALSALSCDKAESPVSMPELAETVTYSVGLDQQTKALGEGKSINYIWCGAYKEVNNDGVVSYTLRSESLTPFTDGIAQCKIEMVRDQSYKVVFVGQYFENMNPEPRPSYRIDEGFARVYMPTAHYATAPATNSDNYDLFTYVDQVTDFRPRAAKNITLSRRVAQINFLVDPADLATAATAGKTPEQSSVTLTGVHEYISLLDGTVSDTFVDVQYARAPLTNLNENTLATVFCLASETSKDVNASLYIYNANGETLKEYSSIPGIPYKANYRTNVKVSYKF